MRFAFAAVLLALTPGASAQSDAPAQVARTVRFDGQLDALDDTLTTGEALDRYLFDVDAGETITVEMVSDAFDTWLVLKQPGGTQLDNDDWNGNRRVSRIVALADSNGTFEALATSYAPGMTGAYRITISKAPPADPDRLRYSGGSRNGDFFGGGSLLGSVWMQDCPGAAVSRRYVMFDRDGALHTSDDSDAGLALPEDGSIAEAPAARWIVDDGTLTLVHADDRVRYTLTEAPLLVGADSDACGGAARLLLLR